MNNDTLLRAERWLNELGIKTQVHNITVLAANRADIIELLGENGELTILKELKAAVSTKLFSSESDASWVYLESF